MSEEKKLTLDDLVQMVVQGQRQAALEYVGNLPETERDELIPQIIANVKRVKAENEAKIRKPQQHAQPAVQTTPPKSNPQSTESSKDAAVICEIDEPPPHSFSDDEIDESVKSPSKTKSQPNSSSKNTPQEEVEKVIHTGSSPKQRKLSTVDSLHSDSSTSTSTSTSSSNSSKNQVIDESEPSFKSQERQNVAPVASRGLNQVLDEEEATPIVKALEPLYGGEFDRLWRAASDDTTHRVSGKMAIQMFSHCKLDQETLKVIWRISDDQKKGFLVREQFYTALRLISLAQQNLEPSLSAIAEYNNGSGPEAIPPPQFDSLTPTLAKTVAGLSIKPKVIVAELRTGTIFKHTEYEITTAEFGAIVRRRFKDFLWYHENLKKLYPYRFIMPPPLKKSTLGRFDLGFVEMRRRSMERFLAYVGNHQVLRGAPITRFFLTQPGSGIADAKQTFESESVTHPMAGTNLADHLPKNIKESMIKVNENILTLESQLTNIHHLGTQIVEFRASMSEAMMKMGQYTFETFVGDEGRGTKSFLVPQVSQQFALGMRAIQPVCEGLSSLYSEQSRADNVRYVESIGKLLSLTLAAKQVMALRTKMSKDLATLRAKITNNKARLTGLKAKGRVGRTVQNLEQQISDDVAKAKLADKELNFMAYCLLDETREYSAAKISTLAKNYIYMIESSIDFQSQVLTQWQTLLPKVKPKITPLTTMNASDL